MSSQLHSGFILVQAVAHLLLPRFRVNPLSQSSFLVELGNPLSQSSFLAKHELGYKWNSFCSIFLPWNSGQIYRTLKMCNFVVPYGTLSTQSLIYTMVKRGRCHHCYGLRSCNWGVPCWVKSTPSFSSVLSWCITFQCALLTSHLRSPTP